MNLGFCFNLVVAIIISFTVIHTVLEICSVISNMDHALHANTWKFIIKYVFKLLAFFCNMTRLCFYISRFSLILCSEFLLKLKLENTIPLEI